MGLPYVSRTKAQWLQKNNMVAVIIKGSNEMTIRFVLCLIKRFDVSFSE